MPKVQITLDVKTFKKLTEASISERRPVPLQAEVILRRALGQPFPIPVKDNQPRTEEMTYERQTS